LNNIKPELNIDILTNLQLDEDEFIRHVDPERIKRKSPYASIRVSYHPEVMELEPLIKKVLKFQDAGFSIGIWGVMHPVQTEDIVKAQQRCKALGIDFRTKEFLGEYKGRLYGKYRYEGACEKISKKRVLCKTTELIIGGDGSVYRCHSDLYEGVALPPKLIGTERGVLGGRHEFVRHRFSSRSLGVSRSRGAGQRISTAGRSIT
jgi:hypothetical protein